MSNDYFKDALVADLENLLPVARIRRLADMIENNRRHLARISAVEPGDILEAEHEEGRQIMISQLRVMYDVLIDIGTAHVATLKD
jgi:hypothetical protein